MPFYKRYGKEFKYQQSQSPINKLDGQQNWHIAQKYIPIHIINFTQKKYTGVWLFSRAWRMLIQTVVEPNLSPTRCTVPFPIPSSPNLEHLPHLKSTPSSSGSALLRKAAWHPPPSNGSGPTYCLLYSIYTNTRAEHWNYGLGPKTPLLAPQLPLKWGGVQIGMKSIDSIFSPRTNTQSHIAVWE